MTRQTRYFDEYTGEILPMEIVQAAMTEELTDFSEKTGWAATDYSEMKANPDATCVRTRWVLCNKRNEKDPDVRARLVACEIAKDNQSQFYASTPSRGEETPIQPLCEGENSGGQATPAQFRGRQECVLQRKTNA